jgi:type VI secretion system secreted protein VgrG
MATTVASTQAARPLSVTTPLGKDALLLVGFTGQEALSRLFNFHLDLLAENAKDVAFDKLLGQPVTVELTVEKKRYFNGICYRVSQGERGQEYTAYRVELVPELWLLSKRAQSRTFQHLSVPDILKKVLGDLKTKPTFKLEGTFQPRDYCVQYRETDFNFASRLMEEEGIYYYFKHDNGSHTLVVANTPGGHDAVPEQSPATYKNIEGGEPGFYVYDWEKVQELRAGKVTLWDHCFELPHKHLEVTKATTPPEVQAGQTGHKLKVGGNDRLELYDYPGEYAQRFDGVDKGGGDQPAELSKITQDNQRTAEIRMQEETAGSVLAQGAGNCHHFSAGHKFTLQTLPNSLEKQFKADGAYVLTGVQHAARLPGGDYRSGAGGGFHYHNAFTCAPAQLPFRPARLTPKPVVHGTQTAVVVGLPGEEIFTDKYGRVKVQFHWDREGKNNADSSCWCRVGTLWAGKQWGAIHIPRVGQEVIVAFEEGDPDRPIVVGSVYNAEMMPPYKLPDHKTQSGIKSRSSLRGTEENFNEFCFEDKKGEELVYLRAEKDYTLAVEHDEAHWVGNDRTKTVDNDETTTVGNNRTETVEKGNEKITIKKGNRDVLIEMGNETLLIKMGNQTTKLNMGKSETEAMQSIELKVGQSSVKLDQTGVTIKGMLIKIEGQVQTDVKGLMTQITGSAMLKMGGGITMIG